MFYSELGRITLKTQEYYSVILKRLTYNALVFNDMYLIVQRWYKFYPSYRGEIFMPSTKDILHFWTVTFRESNKHRLNKDGTINWAQTLWHHQFQNASYYYIDADAALHNTLMKLNFNYSDYSGADRVYAEKVAEDITDSVENVFSILRSIRRKALPLRIILE